MDFLLDSPVLVIAIVAVAIYLLLTTSLAIGRFRRKSGGTVAAVVSGKEAECPSCGQTNPAKAAYCRRCGKKI